MMNSSSHINNVKIEPILSIIYCKIMFFNIFRDNSKKRWEFRNINMPKYNQLFVCYLFFGITPREFLIILEYFTKKCFPNLNKT